MSRLDRPTSNNTKVANTASFTLMFHQIVSAFGTSSELVFSVAWVEAVNFVAFAWVNHHPVRVLSNTESTIDYRKVYSVHLHLIVEL